VHIDREETNVSDPDTPANDDAEPGPERTQGGLTREEANALWERTLDH